MQVENQLLYQQQEVTSKRQNKMVKRKYSSKFNFPKEFEVIRTSGDWRTLEINPDNMEALKFYISDSGEIYVEFIACAYDIVTSKYENIHICLSDFKEFIEEAEQIASVTFDEEDKLENE